MADPPTTGREALALPDELRRWAINRERCRLDPTLLREAADLLDALAADLTAAHAERDSQMQAKLDAQRSLAAITEALDLKLADLGNGWKEGVVVILARIETIVDEADRGFRERDAALAREQTLRDALAFYATEATYYAGSYGSRRSGPSIDGDKGKRARAALASAAEPAPEERDAACVERVARVRDGCIRSALLSLPEVV